MGFSGTFCASPEASQMPLISFARVNTDRKPAGNGSPLFLLSVVTVVSPTAITALSDSVSSSRFLFVDCFVVTDWLGVPADGVFADKGND